MKAEDDAAVGGRMEAIRFLINSDGDYYTHHLAGEGEYYHKPEADAVIARLEGVILEFEKLRNEKKDKIIDYRKRGEIAETGVARLESDLFQAQAKSSRLEARCNDLQDEVAKRDHQVEVLNADLTRCQEAKTAIGDKCLRLESEVERLNKVINEIVERHTSKPSAEVSRMVFTRTDRPMTFNESLQAIKKLRSENAALRERLERLVDAASLCVPDEGQVVTFDDLVQHIDGLRQAIAAAESGKEEGCSTSLHAAAENLIFKYRKGVPLEAVDFEWLERAVGGENEMHGM